jgi:hypothetical protein
MVDMEVGIASGEDKVIPICLLQRHFDVFVPNY